MNNILDLTLEEIKNGYSFDEQKRKYICHVCNKVFETGEIFKIGDRFFEASKAIELHIQKEHPSKLDSLISNNKKYSGITDNQKELLEMINKGMTDNEIATRTGVAASTIRHQRFTFREKAKQAKVYLAIYELATQGTETVIQETKVSDRDEEQIYIHKGATMLDDRYSITNAEEEKILSTVFESLQPLKLKIFSPKEKKKIVILRKISEQFVRERRYTEKEVNSFLKDIFEDYATIRRYLIEYGFMERTTDCREYWLK